MSKAKNSFMSWLDSPHTLTTGELLLSWVVGWFLITVSSWFWQFLIDPAIRHVFGLRGY